MLYLQNWRLYKHVNLKAGPQCQSPSQIGGAAWPSGLVEQLKSPGVDNKLSGFIVSNEANWLHHLVRLNVGKHQRKPGQFRRLQFFARNFRHLLPPPTLSQSQDPLEFAILYLRQTFLNILNSQKCWTKTQYCEFEGPAISPIVIAESSNL